MFFWKNGDVLAHSLCWKFPLNLKLFDHNFALQIRHLLRGSISLFSFAFQSKKF
ncbi:hypothetical protein NBRC3257_0727 [Gluconobacter thailandicus NBRC 3257]|uniref:Transposase n=1 Tax=Gluconobacter thailandicus NBRC 3257 TaxID=1381097 RepID=A0ABQ0IW34_GLUTH|nr:hypothetical protein NBRC3255_1766 [Gluconobacter thailandicus NBRC 3255]GAD25728.1 hypothetical protein NBRC3257_0727 [Gluconobacter thailandicus NBRC 3257]